MQSGFFGRDRTQNNCGARRLLMPRATAQAAGCVPKQRGRDRTLNARCLHESELPFFAPLSLPGAARLLCSRARARLAVLRNRTILWSTRRVGAKLARGLWVGKQLRPATTGGECRTCGRPPWQLALTTWRIRVRQGVVYFQDGEMGVGVSRLGDHDSSAPPMLHLLWFQY